MLIAGWSIEHNMIIIQSLRFVSYNHIMFNALGQDNQ